MKIFKLEYSYKHNMEWEALISDPLQMHKLIPLFIKKNNISKENTIEMSYVNIHEDFTERTELPFNSDIIRWDKNISYYNNNRTDLPSAAVIITEKIKNIFVKFNLPSYNSIPLKLLNRNEKLENNQYELFYFHHIPYEETLDLSEHEFIYKDLKSGEIIKTEIGSFNSLAELVKIKTEYIQEKGINILLGDRVFNADHDILWGTGNTLYINEKVKQEIELSSTKGISIVETKMKYSSKVSMP